jgi:hypothetical protein
MFLLDEMRIFEFINKLMSPNFFQTDMRGLCTKCLGISAQCLFTLETCLACLLLNFMAWLAQGYSAPFPQIGFPQPRGIDSREGRRQGTENGESQLI